MSHFIRGLPNLIKTQMSNNDFIYDLCIKSLNNPNKITNDQKKQYMKNLFTDFAQNKIEEALKKGKGEDVYLKITYKYAKYLLSQGKKDDATPKLQWIVNNKKSLIKAKVKDLYLIGSAQVLLDSTFRIIDDEDKINFSCYNDYQIFKYYQDNHRDDEIEIFIKNVAKEVRDDNKTIKNVDFLEQIFYATSSKVRKIGFENMLLFFRLYFSRLLSKKEISPEKQKKKIEELLKEFLKLFIELLNPNAEINLVLHKEICEFYKFYDSYIYNYICDKKLNYMFLGKFYETINSMLDKIVYMEHTNPEINTYIKFRFGLYKYRPNEPMQSEIYFRAAAIQNYFKAIYFLSEIVKYSNQKEALDLYDKIIKYEIGKNESESMNLNNESDRFEKACALYQKGLVYAEGLYSKNIDWEIVDQCWGNPESDLCITKIVVLKRFHYISTEYLNLQFIKYKADHGLLEAKHMYFKICTDEKLTNENDILVIYMHELCLFSNYDEKYLREMKEYARRLYVGEGVEKDKKKAKMIKDRILKVKNE